MASFSAIDYVVFFATIAISFIIGVVFAVRERHKATAEDYFLAGRRFRILPAALSFVVTFQSSQMILGTPVEVYLYGAAFCYYFVGIVLAYVFAGVTVVPVVHSLRLTSVYKYFEIRFQSNLIRYMVMFGAVVYILFYVATVTYGTCVALDVVIGIPFWATVLIYTTITTIYTAVGGIKAVIWTDVFQFVIMVTGILAVHIRATSVIGGPGRVLEFASSRMNLDDMSFDVTTRYNLWNCSAGSFCIFMYCAYAQAGIQRINSTPSARTGRLMYVISGPIFATIFLLAATQGVVVFAYHALNGCDPIGSGELENVNALLPVTILQLFENVPGMAGLFIASLSSAALSTLSSCLNSISAMVYGEILTVNFPDMSEQRATFFSKIVVLVTGIVGIVLTFAVSNIPGSVVSIFMALMGCMEGPTVGVFLLSTMWRRSTAPGVVAGSITGTALTLWISLGRMLSSVPSDPTLPSGPVDTCMMTNTSFNATSIHSYYNSSDVPTVSTPASTHASFFGNMMNSTVMPDTDIQLTPLQNFYSVSIVTYSFIGMATTVIVGIVVSLFTKPPKVIDDRCIFSFKRHVSGARDNEKSTYIPEEMQPMNKA